MALRRARALRWLELLPLAALWAALALGLSALTTRVQDWFVMTDELLYERLAISVAALGSPLPHVHGETIPNVNGLYPLLLAPAFADGLVPDSLIDAHELNAWVMSSACVPAFLLARRVTGSRLAAYAVALLTVCLPWTVLASFLLTEVAGYPAFLWALLGLQAAVARPSRRNDVLALLGIGLAVFARTQFEVLLVVLPLTVLAYELGRERDLRAAVRASVRRHVVLAWAYAALAAAAVVLAALGYASRVLGTYRGALEGQLVPGGLGRSLLEHLSTLALGLAIVPLVVGLAWALATMLRPAGAELHAFACLASVTLAAVAVEVTVFDLRFGDGSVRDRYLFYVAPVVLLAFACALLDARPPRWALAVPAALVALGFTVDRLPTYVRFHADSPVAVLHGPLLDAFGGLDGARAALVAVTALVAVAAAFAPWRALAVALAALVLVALPLQTAHAFDELFSHDGTSGRPVSVAQGGVFNWIDRTIGPDAEVTIVPYPDLPGEYGPSVATWWDLEFWNRSVTRALHRPGQFEWTPTTFPKLHVDVDPATGRLGSSPTRYVAHSGKESRFRVAGNAVSDTRGTLLVEAEQPWRVDWLSSGLDPDGWTRPGTPAHVRVYATPGQRGAVRRAVSLGLRAPTDVSGRTVELRSNLERFTDVATNGATLFRNVNLCVPAGGYAELELSTPDYSTVYGDMSSQTTFEQFREGGVLLVQIALADETGGPCQPRDLG